jgi:hypothetical protein
VASALPRDTIPAQDANQNNTEPEKNGDADYIDKQRVADSTRLSIQEQIEKARQSGLPQQDSTTADTTNNNGNF